MDVKLLVDQMYRSLAKDDAVNRIARLEAIIEECGNWDCCQFGSFMNAEESCYQAIPSSTDAWCPICLADALRCPEGPVGLVYQTDQVRRRGSGWG